MLKKHFEEFTKKNAGKTVNVRIKPKEYITGTLVVENNRIEVKNREKSLSINADIVRNISIADVQKKRKAERKKKAV